MTKILYVEDEPFLGKIVKESLESRKYEVQMVADGQKVLAAYEQFQPDICVLDVMLPNVDGFTLGGRIRQQSPDMPIIFLTAKTQTEDVLKGFQSGGNDYVRKPFSVEELIIRIENLLALVRGKALVPEHCVAIGQYEFDTNKQELRLGDTVRKLSHRESELLKILVEHRNFSVERKKILNQIWGDDSFFNSRNLDVYIKKLRDYLQEDAEVEIITLKGVGYHFVAP